MAAKNSYSIDDILNEYNLDEQNAEESEKKEQPEDTEKKAEESESDSESSPEPASENSNKSSEDASEKDAPEETQKTENKEQNEFQSKNIGYAHRSATRIQDKPNKIVKNPENNIRYVRRENDTIKSTSDNIKMSEKRKSGKKPETKSDISVLEQSKTEKKEFKIPDISSAFTKISDIKKNIKGHKSVSEKEHSIDIKSIPDVDFFSIDIDINDDSDNRYGKEKSEGFFSELNKSFTRSAENNIDDYNSPGDASLILDDLYNLKSSLTTKGYIQLAAAIISTYFSAASMYGIPLPSAINLSSSPHTYSLIMFIISAIVMFSSFPVIIGGLKNLFRKKADCDTLASISIIFSTIAAAASTESPELLQNGSICIFTPVAIAGFFMNTVGKHLIVNRAINNFDLLTSSSSKSALMYIDNEARAEQLTKGIINDYPILAATKKTSFAENFLKYTYSSDMADKLCRKTIPALMIFSAVMTIASVFICKNSTDSISLSFITSVYSMFISAFSCFGIPLVVNMPLSDAAAYAEENEGILFGYQSIDDFYDTNALLLNTSQIFPDSSVKLCAIKMFSDTKIDDAIIAAASIVKHSGSIFSEMFTRIIDNNLSLLEKVENYSYEDSNGLCGWINHKRVLFGNRQLMINHNIENLPPKSKEKDIIGKGRCALYLSVSGNLSAIFIVKLKADENVKASLNEIIDNDISLVIKSIDSITTVTGISKLFGIPEDRIKIVPVEHHDFCDKTTESVKKSSSSVVCSGTLSSIAKAMTNIKNIYHISLTGIILQSASAIIALLIALTFMLLGIINLVTPLLFIFYHLIWLAITIIVMRIKPR